MRFAAAARGERAPVQVLSGAAELSAAFPHHPRNPQGLTPLDWAIRGHE